MKLPGNATKQAQDAELRRSMEAGKNYAVLLVDDNQPHGWFVWEGSALDFIDTAIPFTYRLGEWVPDELNAPTWVRARMPYTNLMPFEWRPCIIGDEIVAVIIRRPDHDENLW